MHEGRASNAWAASGFLIVRMTHERNGENELFELADELVEGELDARRGARRGLLAEDALAHGLRQSDGSFLHGRGGFLGVAGLDGGAGALDGATHGSAKSAVTVG